MPYYTLKTMWNKGNFDCLVWCRRNWCLCDGDV